MKLYATALSAQQQKGQSVNVATRAYALMASNVDEAVGIALRRAQELLPDSEGWHSHIANVVEINLDEVHKAIPCK